MAATQGGCLCGKVRYEYTGADHQTQYIGHPANIHIGDIALKAFCNCKDCQRWGGAPGMANVVVPRETFKITEGKSDPAPSVERQMSANEAKPGEPKTFDTVGGSGKINKHFFCGDCGSSLYCELEVMADKTAIK